MNGESMSEGKDLLVVKQLSKSYNGKDVALKELDLTVERGEFVAIIGRSGAGKSTMLRCINRLIEPTTGSIVFDGQEMMGLRGRALRQARRRISMVFQHYNLVYRSSSMDNVLQGRLGYKSAVAGALGLFSEDDKEKAFCMLDRVGLADFALTRTDRLSGGQRQRVGIARALVQDPLLILADEPIASLDPASSRTVMELLRWAVDELGVAALVSLHQVDFALEFSDRIIGLADGELLYDGAPEGLTDGIIAQIYGDDADSPETPFGHGGAGVLTVDDRDALPAIDPADETDPGAGESVVAVGLVAEGRDAS